MPPRDPKHLIAASSAIAALVISMMGGYIALNNKVTALAATASTRDEVEHIVDLKTASRLDEILRRLSQIDARLEQLQALRTGARQAKE